MSLLYKTGPMESLRKWFYKPKRDDRSLLAQFFFADDALNMVAAELDSFDGRKDPERCSTLVNQLRHAQDRVLNITSQIMDQVLGDERVARGFRVKFPEDVLQDNLAGQLWFGAECLAAGSSIMNREEESAAMRPLAKALTHSLETVRSLLREQCLRGMTLSQHDDALPECLSIFDRLFAEFELCYVSAMVNVKTPHEFEAQQLICVLFSESLRRALKQHLLTQEQVDSYDPALMFAVPRLAIVSGLLIYSSGPLSIDKSPEEMSDMFRPFRTLLHKIRSLLWTLSRGELAALQRLLCTNEDSTHLQPQPQPLHNDAMTDSQTYQYPDIGEFVSRFYADHVHCRDLYTQESEPTITDADYLPDNIEVMTPLIYASRLDGDPPEENKPEPNRLLTTDNETFPDKRKTSRTEQDLAALRNLSTNGLNMFDPLVINAASSSERQIPDQELVESLNEQVTEIADRLSSIVNNDVDVQTHSYSTNDVPNLTDDGPRNEQMSCLPSTSHGYLIPNAISQEPVVLASLSHNNSAVFNQEEADINSVILNSDLPLIRDNVDAEIVNNICIANVNLSSLLLTNDEMRESFEEDTFHNNIDNVEGDRVKFMLGYESDHESAVDSGVSTENTSLDRSPDTEQNNVKDHFMQQNRVLTSTDERNDDKANTLESSFSNSDVTINYVENEGAKNEAGSSKHEPSEEELKVLQDWGIQPATEPSSNYSTMEDVITELRRRREDKKDVSNTTSEPAQSSGRQRMKRKSSKTKKKKKMWSPAIVILDSRATTQSPLRLNLDHLVDDSNTCLTSDCADDEQIALALQAQELAARQQARGKFKSSEDLIHRLFVCIAGVADQLQTNFAADLRNILKSVFLMNQTPEPPEEAQADPAPIEYQPNDDQVIQNGSSFDSVYSAEEVYADSNSSTQSAPPAPQRCAGAELTPQRCAGAELTPQRCAGAELTPQRCVGAATELHTAVSTGDLTNRSPPVTSCANSVERAPEWVPDIAAPTCMRCTAHFTAFRRRHHCRNCGKVFCASCSSNSIPLPRYGQMKPVRVCEECFGSIAQSCRRTTNR